MIRTIYARYNRHRLPHCQTATLIVRDGAQCFVIKQALTPNARLHLEKIRAAHRLMSERRATSRLALPELIEERSNPDALVIEFIDAPSLDQVLLQSLRKRDCRTFWDALDDYHLFIRTAFGTVSKPIITPELRATVGCFLDDNPGSLGPCAGLALIDLSFENILIQGGKRVCIDNEWVMEGALPVKFALARSLFYFFKVKYAPLQLEFIISMDDAFQRFGISESEATLFREMDQHFQTFVFGAERNCDYHSRYAHYAHVSIASMEQTIEHQRQEVHRLNQKISTMIELPAWCMLDKLRRILSVLAPPGTVRRRVLLKLAGVSKNDNLKTEPKATT